MRCSNAHRVPTQPGDVLIHFGRRAIVFSCCCFLTTKHMYSDTPTFIHHAHLFVLAIVKRGSDLVANPHSAKSYPMNTCLTGNLLHLLNLRCRKIPYIFFHRTNEKRLHSRKKAEGKSKKNVFISMVEQSGFKPFCCIPNANKWQHTHTQKQRDMTK